MELTVYVDGSYNSNGHVYGGGVVVLVPGVEKPLEHRVSGADSNAARLRNVAGEIMAVLQAVKLAQAVKCTKLTIHYDYKGLSSWCEPEGSPDFWKAKNNFTKAYRHMMVEAMNEMEIVFVKEKAHTGVRFNELADRLAKEACRIV